ncbi:hypothetical protein C162_12768 [Paenibacillus sp. FSL R7-269]|uniref:hypothetical protein n=1 Tax=Paenibacillus sp. FSL R7-269 TaxID=1226755 RepID=UPI0003E20002|nr:hypothetical protein [Paenibacillus sp. FSL R7-269]ETT49758.1 hypothetical protein C162_12768 [Paenibacillus sp. FSL R7-269]
MNNYIIDTNVWMVASEEGDFSAETMDICRQFLQSIKQNSAAKVVMDQASFDTNVPGNSVYYELKRNLVEGSYAHDLFNKYILNEFRFELIELNYDSEGAVIPGGIQIFQRFAGGGVVPFEPNDRKWIALYLNCPSNPIFNACDSDWENAREDLIANKIRVHQLLTGNHI